ncbi:MAG: bacterial transcriptional activator domain-containing protein [Anaerolineae bacterium]|nr:bacterial transcriptional activator domain-containing protein [Anaerolineae bacterium]
MLEVKLFGIGQAQFNQQPLIDFPNQQPSLLLCYLLINNRYPHHREHLSTILGGDTSTRNARKRLRNVLWRLRKTFQSVGMSLDDYLLVAEDTISFINSSNYWLDIEIFETKTEYCKDLSGREISPEQVSQLEEAVNLYSGDLLESTYEDWVIYDREKYRIAHLNALNKLMVYHGLNGNYERGLAYGENILARDSTREKVHRQMMWLYYLAGNRNAALTQYKRCCQTLMDELGVYPMGETKYMHELILNNEFNAQSWLGNQLTPIFPEKITDRSIRPLVKRALKKLNGLQEIIEGTSAELRLIEQKINEAMTESPPHKKVIPKRNQN